MPSGEDAAANRGAVEDVVLGLIVEAVIAAGVSLPQPVIRTAVKAAFRFLPDVDVPSLARTLTRLLGVPREYLGPLEKLLYADLHELQCPAEAVSVLVPSEPGSYECPACGDDIEVGRRALHAQLEIVKLECPVTKKTLELKSGPGAYECYCGAEIKFADGVAEHDNVAEVDCTESGEPQYLTDGPGTYVCEDCGADIVFADDGEARHAYEVACPVSEESFWVGPEDGTYECDCGAEIAVKDGVAHHTTVIEVSCPESGAAMQLLEGPGTYECDSCGADIVLRRNGTARHS